MSEVLASLEHESLGKSLSPRRKLRPHGRTSRLIETFEAHNMQLAYPTQRVLVDGATRLTSS